MNSKPDCLTCTNSNCLVNKNSHKEAAAEFIQRRHTIRARKGQHFIAEGAPVHGLFFVFTGKAKVTNAGINGRDQILRFSKDGEIIGHRGFATGDSYGVSAVAMEDTVLCNFDNDTLSQMLTNLPSFTYDLLCFYADELNKSETKVRKIAQMSVREKVIDTLLYLNRKFGQVEGLLDIPVSRRDIADFAGTTEEQAIRVLSSLKKEGLTIASGRKIGIAKDDLLRKEISEHNFFINS